MGGILFSDGKQGVNLFQLSQTNGGLNISHPVIKGYFRVPVRVVTVSPLVFQKESSFGPLFSVGNNDTAFTGGDNFVAVKTEHGRIAQSANPLPVIYRAVCFGGIFKQKQVVGIGDLAQRVPYWPDVRTGAPP
jgi:hypothetical protein